MGMTQGPFRSNVNNAAKVNHGPFGLKILAERSGVRAATLD
jgi:hypothetical protein